MAKGVGGKRKLKFKTTERENASKKRRFVIAFIAIVLILAALSVVTYIKEHKNQGGEEDASGTTMNTLPQTKMKDVVSLLFIGTSTTDNAPLFASLIKFDTENNSMTVVPVSTDGVAADKSAELASAFESDKGIKFDRYVVVNEKNFKTFVGVLGTYETTVESAVDYKGDDFSLNLLSGKQKLTGDKLFKYIRYLGNSDYSLKKQGKLVADFLSQKLNETNTGKGEDVFSSLINSSDSDITIVDYSKYKDWLVEISKEPRNITVELGNGA